MHAGTRVRGGLSFSYSPKTWGGEGGGGVRTDCGVCDKEVEINLDFFYFERDRQKGNISQSSKNHCNH